MLFSKSLFLVSAGLVTASPLDDRAICGEGPQRVCYGIDGGESQNLNPADVQYVADYLRYLGDENEENGGTLLALAKHISARVKSSILYEDLAAAIDGGLDAPDGGKKELLGCGKNGSMMGVTANLENPLYSTDSYKEGNAKPGGILVRLVEAPAA